MDTVELNHHDAEALDADMAILDLHVALRETLLREREGDPNHPLDQEPHFLLTIAYLMGKSAGQDESDAYWNGCPQTPAV
jgi:hypothetical protein